MAFVTAFTCKHCGNEVTEVVLPARICARCRIAIYDADLEKYKTMCRLKPLEKRVEEIEESLFRLNIDSRLRHLEIQNQRF